MDGMTVEMTGISPNREEVDHPTDYNDDLAYMGGLIVKYLNASMGIYTKKELGGIVKFCFDFFGIELDYGWDDRPGWFCVTEDMVIDRMAQEQVEQEAEKAEALAGAMEVA